MTRDGGDAVLARFTPRRYMLIMAVPMAVLAMLLLAGAITAAVNNQPIGVLWCVVILPVPLLVICTRLALLRVVLTATHLSTPRILHGWTTVPLAEIAGVGMHYHSGGRAASWCLTVWCAQGSGIGINVEPPNHSAPRRPRRPAHQQTGARFPGPGRPSGNTAAPAPRSCHRIGSHRVLVTRRSRWGHSAPHTHQLGAHNLTLIAGQTAGSLAVPLGERPTGTRGGWADLAQTWFSSFRSGILDRTLRVPASNTSSIPLAKVAPATKRAQQVVDVQFFNPVPVLPLADIVESLLTRQESLRAVSIFAELSGLSCVVSQCASTSWRTASSCVDVPRAMR